MTVLVTVEAVALVLLAVLVAGLLRSHADILQALHNMGAGVEQLSPSTPVGPPTLRLGSASGVPSPRQEPTGVFDIVGTTPIDEAMTIGVVGTEHNTLIAFLSSSCTTCQGFWDAFGRGAADELPDYTRAVIVTRGPTDESPSRVRQLAPRDIPVVMSNDAWESYDVPVAPYFLYVDGQERKIVGEGAAARWEQLASLFGQAVDDAQAGGSPSRLRARRHRLAAADARREERADRDLMAAGIHPGHPSLHPAPRADIGR